jgi:hypothetical protein
MIQNIRSRDGRGTPGSARSSRRRQRLVPLLLSQLDAQAVALRQGALLNKNLILQALCNSTVHLQKHADILYGKTEISLHAGLRSLRRTFVFV